eukprot:GILJ01006048.1.p1 GENE.GILJ01006048.1~~GILJ01006048.1.p1  ORF type:complete len:674 (+),score=92.32 GILJ01006048.1:1592-3613(+)
MPTESIAVSRFYNWTSTPLPVQTMASLSKVGGIDYRTAINTTTANTGDACFLLNKRSCVAVDDTAPSVCTSFHSTVQRHSQGCQSWCKANPAACDAAKIKFCTANPTRPECGCISAEQATMVDGTTYLQYQEYMKKNVVPNMLATVSSMRSCWWGPCRATQATFKLSTEPTCVGSPNICISQGNSIIINGTINTSGGAVNALNINCSGGTTLSSNSVANKTVDFSSSDQVAVLDDNNNNNDDDNNNDNATETTASHDDNNNNNNNNNSNNNNNNSSNNRSLGVRKKFVSPVNNNDRSNDNNNGGGRYHPTNVFKDHVRNGNNSNNSNNSNNASSGNSVDEEEMPEQFRNLDPKMIEMIQNEILDRSPLVHWTDIAGLTFAKKCINEIVVWPILRPDIFTGLRGPPKGLLLFGPPGTGKTLIGKAIATESGATFFSISASSLTSKWVGEGEKMVRTLFAVASVHQPAVIFIDEIDSLLAQRSEGDFEASRRIKTEFLVQLDGAGTNADDRILVIGASNRPQELDEAVRRRLVKRLYIPLPDIDGRRQLIQTLLSKEESHGNRNTLSSEQLEDICARSHGYSGADMKALCTEAALGPLRSIGDIRNVAAESVPPISYEDFLHAFQQVRASVSQKDLHFYTEWNSQFGSFPMTEPDAPSNGTSATSSNSTTNSSRV